MDDDLPLYHHEARANPEHAYRGMPDALERLCAWLIERGYWMRGERDRDADTYMIICGVEPTLLPFGLHVPKR